VPRLALRLSVPALVSVVACLVPASASAARHLGDRTLRYGDHGHDVRVLQDYLTRYGIDTTVDGAYGVSTRGHVRAFERREDLTANGVLTKADAKVLRSDVEGGAAAYTPTVTATAPAPATGKAVVNPDGTATAPADAPPAVQAIVAAGNRIYDKPYKYGGGHGTWKDSGYDCSGSVSYVLHAAGLLKISRTSGGFESYGVAGRGRWVTIYANGGHAFMKVAGLRFDTSGATQDGSRWHTSKRPTSGYVVRHISGL
jgi:peptidoglycan hydrolase-like protein with peptidoglycan-binding domain